MAFFGNVQGFVKQKLRFFYLRIMAVRLPRRVLGSNRCDRRLIKDPRSGDFAAPMPFPWQI